MAVPAYTVNQIINLALKDSGVIGVGQTPNAEDSNDALTRLNWMIDQWARKRWFIWHLVDLSIVSTGAQSYTIGPGGDIPLPNGRPDRLEAAFLRQLTSPNNPIDYPLELIESREVYNLIALKQLMSFPTWIFYDTAYPLGVLYPWPVPSPTIYEVHVTVKDQLNEFSSLSQNINFLAPEYFDAIHSNLGVILRDAYDLPPKVVLVARAKKSLNTLRQANAQVPRLGMPAGLLKPGIYNVFSDQTR